MHFRYLPRAPCVFAALLIAKPLLGAAGDHDAAFAATVQPLLQKYCYDCHGAQNQKAGLNLADYPTAASVLEDRMTWETALQYVHAYEMPSVEAKVQPTGPERDTITDWIRDVLYDFDPNKPDPGRVTIRRLNRSEYNHTIRDLVGVGFSPADDFPADNSGYGFDNIGDVLSVPPVLLEKYLAAAERILDEAIPTQPVAAKVQRMRANMMERGFNAVGDRGDGWMPLSGLEEDGVGVTQPMAAGDYLIRAEAYSGGRNGAPINLSVMIDNTFVHAWSVAATKDEPGVYEARISVPAGSPRISVLNRRLRGGDNELQMRNGRIGPQQAGNVFVRWVELEGPVLNAREHQPAADLPLTGRGRLVREHSRLLDTEGEVTLPIKASIGGDYILRVQASAQQAGSEPAQLQVRINGQPVETFDVLASDTLKPIEGQRVFSSVLLNAQPQVYEVRTRLAPGEHRFSAAFINDASDPENPNPNLRERNLIIDHLEYVGLDEPVPLPAMPEPFDLLFAQHAGTSEQPAAARAIVAEFAGRAWRRPLSADEIDGLMGFYAMSREEGGTFKEAVKLALKPVLVSPHFLFRGEMQPEPDNPSEIHPVNEYALASRLSYFLWSSLPDDELLAAAARGELRDRLGDQVRRMLASPKAAALVENFTGQWLEIRNLDYVEPDAELFPSFDDSLRRAMRRETELFFASILEEDRSVVDFLDAGYTYVNERLAAHYNLPGVVGDQFRRVSLEGTPRRGILTHASVLTLTSNPNRTSPVKRGKWVLDNLLGTPPPPAPPDVPELPEDGQVAGGTLRQQFEQHRNNPVCASCHARMDPIGFGLENFDAIGAYRSTEAGLPIDSSGELVSGERFQSGAELSGVLAENKRDFFVRCLVEKMLIYALGRGIEPYDRPAVDAIMAGMAADDHSFSSLILGIAQSAPFQLRRGEAPRVASR